MSLRTIADRISRETEMELDRMAEEAAQADLGDAQNALNTSPSPVPLTGSAPPAVSEPPPEPSAEVIGEAADPPPSAPPVLAPAAPPRRPVRDLGDPPVPAPAAPPRRPGPGSAVPTVPAPVPVAVPVAPDDRAAGPAEPQDPEGPVQPPDQPPAPPGGLRPGADAILLSPEERVALLSSLKIDGSVSDGGSAEDLLSGKHPRPSVASQREIDKMNRLRLGDLMITKPLNWPEFMTFPTDLEIRNLRKMGVTPERIAEFEQVKQREADAMEERAREISAWIFTYGTMRLNERAQMSRARNRDAAIRKRSVGPDGKVNPDLDPVSEVTDEELYKDRFYGIRFASLLKTHPDHLNWMRSAPVASWGHDQLITLDGGRIQARGEELVVRSSSLQAAQMLVMEARSRGWETLRVSGNNEFCAAVKRAAKEAGMGAIIHRRGMLGIGPFSAPEVIMPALPGTIMPRMAGATDADTKAREQAAPPSDQEAADLLLRDRAASGKRPDRVRVQDPIRPVEPPGPPGPEPV